MSITIPSSFDSSPSEFTIPRRNKTNRDGPVRWIFSHYLHHWPLGVSMLIGAIGNAALAAVVPVLIGQAFNDILSESPDLSLLVQIAVWIVLTQSHRSFVHPHHLNFYKLVRIMPRLCRFFNSS